MGFNLNNALGIHEQALMARAKRADVIAKNIANIDTPGFKARDIDFKEALKAAQQSPGQLQTTNSKHISQSASDLAMHMKYRTPLTPSLDGNTVDSQLEISAFTENALRYQASLTFVSGKLKGLMTAIRGE